MNKCCEREKFELQEQVINMDNQLQSLRGERDQHIIRLIETEHEMKKESVENCTFQLDKNEN